MLHYSCFSMFFDFGTHLCISIKSWLCLTKERKSIPSRMAQIEMYFQCAPFKGPAGCCNKHLIPEEGVLNRCLSSETVLSNLSKILQQEWRYRPVPDPCCTALGSPGACVWWKHRVMKHILKTSGLELKEHVMMMMMMWRTCSSWI